MGRKERRRKVKEWGGRKGEEWGVEKEQGGGVGSGEGGRGRVGSGEGGRGRWGVEKEEGKQKWAGGMGNCHFRMRKGSLAMKLSVIISPL